MFERKFKSFFDEPVYCIEQCMVACEAKIKTEADVMRWAKRYFREMNHISKIPTYLKLSELRFLITLR